MTNELAQGLLDQYNKSREQLTLSMRQLERSRKRVTILIVATGLVGLSTLVSIIVRLSPIMRVFDYVQFSMLLFIVVLLLVQTAMRQDNSKTAMLLKLDDALSATDKDAKIVSGASTDSERP